MKRMNPKAVWFFFFRYLGPLIIVLMSLGGLVVLGRFFFVKWLVLFFSVFTLLYLIFGYILARLTYRYWNYELTERGLRWKYGIFWHKNILIPYQKIQNVEIKRGVLKRLLGLSGLRIQTAGGVDSSLFRGRVINISAEGQLPALNKRDAEELKKELMKRSELN